MQDASCGDAPGTGAGWTERVYADPYGVKVTTFGRASPIGRCTPVVITRKTGRKGLVWQRLDIDCLELSHVTALLVIQGLPLKKLFEGVSFSSSTFQQNGTFIFLRGELSSVRDPPPRLRDIVLVEVVTLPDDMVEEEALEAFLQDVFPSPQT
jgi:hypothetical protein